MKQQLVQRKLLSENDYFDFGNFCGVSEKRIAQLYDWAQAKQLSDIDLMTVIDKEKNIPPSKDLFYYELLMLSSGLYLSSAHEQKNFKKFSETFITARLQNKPLNEAMYLAEAKKQASLARIKKKKISHLALGTVFLLALSGIGSWGSHPTPQEPAKARIIQNQKPLPTIKALKKQHER